MVDLMTPDEIAELLKIDRRSFVRTVSKQPDFPPPVHIVGRIMRWHRDDIQLWLQRHTRRAH